MDDIYCKLQVALRLGDTTHEYHSNEFSMEKHLNTQINKQKYKTVFFIYLFIYIYIYIFFFFFFFLGGGVFSLQNSLLACQVLYHPIKGTCNLQYVIHFLNK